MPQSERKQTFSEALEEYLTARDLREWTGHFSIAGSAQLRMQAAAKRMDELTAPKEQSNG